ncbi:MAG: aminotransferase class I/II-fold pyridoxal phosphate-dependent enzyme [Phycisphaerales bacterium]|nr:MAG: aminotransferase class I/II-fold pyridoxal phosphate-dependent enzyme [Phycisphaerales bacterium]
MHTTGSPTMVSARLRPFGTTIFAEMTRLAIEHKAVNLSQGFPDFDGPAFVRDAAGAAIASGKNQYARPYGEVPLVEAIADWHERGTGLRVDPLAEVTVTSGCTEAIAACMLGLIDPGDEVVLLEPYYDCYRACVAMAGGVAKFVPLRTPTEAGGVFTLDRAELRASFGPRTKAVLLNTPHNPTGKVLTREELGWIGECAIEHDAIVISDEVYEKLVFEADHPHVSIATLPGMRERTIVCSSIGKTFSLTGWKVGWAIAPERLTAGVRAAHQFLTFATATPLQHGAAEALRRADEYVPGLVAELRESRDMLAEALASLGFGVTRPEGAYFIMVDHSAFGDGDDVAFCKRLIERAGVAAIPPSAFYNEKSLGRSLVRFAFCKKRATLEEAVRRLRAGLNGSAVR